LERCDRNQITELSVVLAMEIVVHRLINCSNRATKQGAAIKKLLLCVN
jgi:hypothetical protein